MLGIVVVSSNELLLDLRHIIFTEHRRRLHMDIYLCKIHEIELVLIMSSVGKVNASVATQILISEFGVDFIINIGFAAATNNTLKLGDVVLSTECIQYDFDATAFGYPMACIPCFDSIILKSTIDLEGIYEVGGSTKRGIILTGDRFVDNLDDLHRISQDFPGICIDMEAAAIAQCSCINKVPFLVIKYVSDYGDKNAVKNYKGANPKIGDLLETIICRIECGERYR